MIRKVNFSEFLKNNILIFVIIFVFIIGILVSKNFMTVGNIKNILFNIAVIGFLAIGQTIVMLVKEIDLSISSLMAFAPIAAISITKYIKSLSGIELIEGGQYVTSGLVYIFIFTILVGTIIGIINGLITVKAKVPSIIVTLGMMYTLRGFAYIISKGRPLELIKVAGFKWLGVSTFFQVPVSFFIYLAIGIIGILVLKYTKVGSRIYATGGNEKAAIYSGINTDIWKIIAFTFCGFCASIAALVYSSRLESVEAAQATGYELSAIAIVVIGGTTLQGGRGKLLGTMLSTIALALIINVIDFIGLVSWYQTVIMGLIIIAAAFLYLKRTTKQNHV